MKFKTILIFQGTNVPIKNIQGKEIKTIDNFNNKMR